MELFVWNDRYLTGIDMVDDQHHGLVNTMNDLAEILTRQSTMQHSEIERVYGCLLDYATRHFSDEEALMHEIGIDPRHLEFHEGQHHAFISEILREQTGIAEDPVAAKTLLGFLGHWLIFHILGCDKSMARQFAAIETGVAATDAFAREKQSTGEDSDPLLQALNAMVEQVMDRNSQLVRMNETLESRVADRTQELQQANASLSGLISRLEAEMAESRRLGAELTRANEDLLHLAQTDALTGLPNRRHAMDRIAQAWSESQRHGSPVACVVLDADGFKQVNDAYGHDAGDVVLRELARVLRALIRKEDVLCRMGGDEFLIICPRTDKAGALELAEHLRANVHALHIQVGAGTWHGSLSLGVAEREASCVKVDDLINAADKGLYVAKRAGRNQVGVAGPD